MTKFKIEYSKTRVYGSIYYTSPMYLNDK